MINEVPMMNEEDRLKANNNLFRHLEKTICDGRNEIIDIHNKLSYTYWLLVFLSIIMFIVGLILLSVPAYTAFIGKFDNLQSVILAGFGIVDLAMLFLFRPVERIHRLMGDMSQITLAINSFQEQSALRLLEVNVENRESIGQAAEHIKEAAKNSIVLIQTYFETTKI